MEKYTREDLEQALVTLQSMIDRSVKVQHKFKEGSSQASLVRNRIRALQAASSLISREMEPDRLSESLANDDLAEALPPIESTIRKCEKVLAGSAEGSSQASLTKKMLQALYLSRLLINQELEQG